MNKIILSDTQAIFRAGTAKVLAMEDDFRIIAQCSDTDRMFHAIDTFPGATLLVAATLKPDYSLLRLHLDSANSRAIVIAETGDIPTTYLERGMNGVIFRNITGPGLIDCIRRVGSGETYLPAVVLPPDATEEDLVGTRVRDRLTPKEMKIVALIVQGCKNREIAVRLKTTEQVIKNYLRSIYDKTGVSDRLELALFTIHHRVLAQAAAEVGNRLEAEV